MLPALERSKHPTQNRTLFAGKLEHGTRVTTHQKHKACAHSNRAHRTRCLFTRPQQKLGLNDFAAADGRRIKFSAAVALHGKELSILNIHSSRCCCSSSSIAILVYKRLENPAARVGVKFIPPLPRAERDKNNPRAPFRVYASPISRNPTNHNP